MRWIWAAALLCAGLAARAHAQRASPDEDKFFLSWLQNVLGYRPPQADAPTTTTTRPSGSEQQQPDSKCQPCHCGITNKQRRIVGGVETQVNEYPWVALLTYKGRFYCGASVINSRYVLTAAHCVDRFQKGLMGVRILEHDRNSTSESPSQDFRVEEVVRHSAYSTLNWIARNTQDACYCSDEIVRL